MRAWRDDPMDRALAALIGLAEEYRRYCRETTWDEQKAQMGRECERDFIAACRKVMELARALQPKG